MSSFPEFVVIHDQIENTYQHPIVHYVFADEDIPDIPKEQLVMIHLDESSLISQVDCYSPTFQVTDCIIEHTTVNDQFETIMNMTIEGISTVKHIGSIHTVEQLKDTLYEFKNRNDMIKKTLIPSMELSMSSLKTSTSTH